MEYQVRPRSEEQREGDLEVVPEKPGDHHLSPTAIGYLRYRPRLDQGS